MSREDEGEQFVEEEDEDDDEYDASSGDSMDTEEMYAKYGLAGNPNKRHWIHGKRTEGFICFCICCNGVQIGLELDLACQPDCTNLELGAFFWIERLFLLIFFVEMSIKMNIEYALTHFLILIDGHKRRNHFRKGDRRPIMYWDKGWNIFDFTIVSLSIFDTFFFALGFSAIRIMRVFRVMRLVRTLMLFQRLWLLITGMRDVFVTVGWTFVLLFGLISVASIAVTMGIGHECDPWSDHPLDVRGKPVADWSCPEGTLLYDFRAGQGAVYSDIYHPSDRDPAIPHFWTKNDYFGTIPKSIFTLLQISTLDRWSSHLARPILEFNPLMFWVLFLFLFISRYGLLNVCIGTIVESTMANVDKQTTAVDEMIAEEETKLLISLDRHFVNLGGELGVLDREQVENALARPSVQRKLELLTIPTENVMELFDALTVVLFEKKNSDEDEKNPEVPVKDFCFGILNLKGDARSFPLLKVSREIGICQQKKDRVYKTAERQEQVIDNINDRLEWLTTTFMDRGLPPVIDPPDLHKKFAQNERRTKPKRGNNAKEVGQFSPARERRGSGSSSKGSGSRRQDKWTAELMKQRDRAETDETDAEARPAGRRGPRGTLFG